MTPARRPATLSRSRARPLIVLASLCVPVGVGCGPGERPRDAGPADASSDAEPDGAVDAWLDADADARGGAWPPYAPSPSWTSGEGGRATGAAFGDVDGDGRLDLVVASGNDMEPGPVAVHLARADGSLPPRASTETDERAYHGHLALGDVDGDGWLDLVVAVLLGPDGEGPGGVALYVNEGGSLPPRPSWTPEEAFHSFSVALGDVDLDGDLDLAVAVGEPYHHDPGSDLLFLNEGGAFAEPAAWSPSSAVHSVDLAFVDVDGDSDLDLVFARELAPHALYLNPGEAGGYLPAREPAWEAEGAVFEGNSVDHGDVDGDGWVDLVFSDSGTRHGGSGRVVLHCGPELRACWQAATPPAYPSALALRDLDGDSDLDLAVGSWWGPVRLHRNLGGELEAEPSFVAAAEVVAEAFAFHDLDRGAAVEETFAAAGPLVALPRPCEVLSVEPGPAAAFDGYLSTKTRGPSTVTLRRSPAPDLLVSDWEADRGSALHLHR